MSSLASLRCDGPSAASRWVWNQNSVRVPPTPAAITTCGFATHCWANGLPRAEPNLLLLLHGLGDGPSAFARFAGRIALPQTSALALGAPLPLPHEIPGGAWCDSFEADGELIDGTRCNERRRTDSLARVTRPRLLALLRHLVFGCGWNLERIFLFGYAQGGTAALDLLAHEESIDGSSGGPCRLGGVVSWCGFPLPEASATVPSPLGSGRIGRRTPLLVVGGADDLQTPPKLARRLYAKLREGWVVHRSEEAEGRAEGRTEGKRSDEERERARAADEVDQTLHVLPRRGQAMVGSAGEAKLLMEFFARHLALNSALEDDPSIIRVS